MTDHAKLDEMLDSAAASLSIVGEAVAEHERNSAALKAETKRLAGLNKKSDAALAELAERHAVLQADYEAKTSETGAKLAAIIEETRSKHDSLLGDVSDRHRELEAGLQHRIEQAREQLAGVVFEHVAELRAEGARIQAQLESLAAHRLELETWQRERDRQRTAFLAEQADRWRIETGEREAAVARLAAELKDAMAEQAGQMKAKREEISRGLALTTSQGDRHNEEIDNLERRHKRVFMVAAAALLASVVSIGMWLFR